MNIAGFEEKRTPFQQLVRIFRLVINTAKAAMYSPKKILRALEDTVERILRARKLKTSVLEDDPLSVPALPGITPFEVNIDPSLSDKPTLNVLIPGLAMKEMSGGPNTAINLSYRLASRGVRLRYISTCAPKEPDDEKLWEHFEKLTGLPRSENVEFVCAFNRSKPITLGANDIFFATAWWTTQMVQYIQSKFKESKFIYMIQDFEPGFYGWSSVQALALETYDFDYVGIVNSEMLKTFLLKNRIGKFRNYEEGRDFVSFNPAIDQKVFTPKTVQPAGKRRLVFYARPSKGERNLYEVGVHVLRKGIERGILDEQWDIVFMGEPLPSIPLHKNIYAQPAPWLSYREYADFVASSDIVFSLMMSPHPSYPPLEGASAGVCVLTNSFDGKSKEALESLSRNILAVPPTVSGLIEGLEESVKRAEQRRQGLLNTDQSIGLPSSWEESFRDVVPFLESKVNELLGRSASIPQSSAGLQIQKDSVL